jgi:anthranilate synthase/aminodeoxychorismate synthase-like glutamine amidotransferase
MARLLVVDHHDSYVWNLVHLIAGVTGQVPDVVEHDAEVSFDGYTHLVLSPGPGHPANRGDFALQARAFDHSLPVLGVCLGMQALVTNYGGTVEQIEPAHGVVASIEHSSDPLFAGIPQGFDAVRYHSLAAVELPDEVEPIAWTADSRVVMGVRHRGRPQVGVQFHPESILSEFGARLVSNFLELT